MRIILLLIFVKFIVSLQIYAQSNPSANCYASIKDYQLSIKLIITNETTSGYGEMQFDEFYSNSVFVPISEWLVKLIYHDSVYIGPWDNIDKDLISSVILIPDNNHITIQSMSSLGTFDGDYIKIEYLPKFLHIKSNDTTILMLKYDIPKDSVLNKNYKIFFRLPFIKFLHLSTIDNFYNVIPNCIENDLNYSLDLNKHSLINFSKRKYSLYSTIKLDELLYAIFRISMDSNFIDCNCSLKTSD